MPSTRCSKSSTVRKGAATGPELADLLELELLVGGSPAVAIEQLRRDVEFRASVAGRNMPLALRQIAWRATVLGDLYPFSLDTTSIRVRKPLPIHDAYTALLLMTPGLLARVGAQRDDPDCAIVLENLTCVGLKGLLGPGTESLRFGWPSAEGRPADFNGAIKWLSARMGIRIAGGYKPPRRKDGGVDVIAWRSFGDKRPGFPIVLAQCSIERDLLQKARDIDLKQWSAWLALDAQILVVLVVPGAIPPDERWNEMARNCVILERLRLLSLVALTELTSDLGPFVRRTIDRIVAARSN
jgi:hypothetical protein